MTEFRELEDLADFLRKQISSGVVYVCENDPRIGIASEEIIKQKELTEWIGKWIQEIKDSEIIKTTILGIIAIINDRRVVITISSAEELSFPKRTKPFYSFVTIYKYEE